jgi:hypothetical protein
MRCRLLPPPRELPPSDETERYPLRSWLLLNASITNGISPSIAAVCSKLSFFFFREVVVVHALAFAYFACVASCRAEDWGRAHLYRRVRAFPAWTRARKFDWPAWKFRRPAARPPAGIHFVTWSAGKPGHPSPSRISSPGKMAALMLPCETVGDRRIFSCKGCVHTQPIEEAPLF